MTENTKTIKEQIPENAYTLISLNSDSDLIDIEFNPENDDVYPQEAAGLAAGSAAAIVEGAVGTTEKGVITKTKKTNSLQRFFRKNKPRSDIDVNDNDIGGGGSCTTIDETTTNITTSTNNNDGDTKYGYGRKFSLRKTASFWKKRSENKSQLQTVDVTTSDEPVVDASSSNLNLQRRKNSLSRKFNIRIGVPGRRNADTLPKREQGQMDLAQSCPSMNTSESQSLTGLRALIQTYWNSVFPRKINTDDVNNEPDITSNNTPESTDSQIVNILTDLDITSDVTTVENNTTYTLNESVTQDIATSSKQIN